MEGKDKKMQRRRRGSYRNGGLHNVVVNSVERGRFGGEDE